MPTRRNMLERSAAVAALLAATGLLPARAQSVWNAAAFEARSAADALKALGASAPVESGDVILTAQDVAENGAAVPIGIAARATGVRRLAVMVEKNPTTLIGVFDVGDAVEPAVSIRIKMAESSNIVVAAMLADGRVLYAQKEVKVIVGGCG